jgi:hypothetical protein
LLISYNKGQSCYIAYLSGSTKSVYKLPAGKTKAEGQDAKGEACTKDNLKKLNVTMPPQLSSRTALLEFITSSDEAGFQGISMPEQPVNQLTALEKRQGCKPETLLWVRGTFETGEFGNIAKFGTTVQSTFSKAGWGTIGLKDTDGYDAAASNNYCVGLPGGVACVPWLNKQVANCPNSKFILGGYSQGAMVSRICIAFASPATRAKVKVSNILGIRSLLKTNMVIGTSSLWGSYERSR